MIDLLLIWFGLLVALLVLAIGPPGRGGALTLAYFLGLSLIHVPGVLPYLSEAWGSAGVEDTRLGFQMTVVGMAAFVAGAAAAGARRRRRVGRGSRSPSGADGFERLGWRALAIGGGAYLVLLPLSGLLPSSTPIASALATLLILGFWLILYAGALAGDQRRKLLTLALLPLLPLTTLVSGGFLGYGVYWVLSTLTFFYVVTRQRLWIYLAAPPVVFLGLSLFVTYMGQRSAIREVVWHENSGILDRLERVSRIVTDFELLDLSSPAHLAAIDGRLNQNSLVGVAIARHEAGIYDFAYGGTVPYWVLIPRAIWPDKPAVGGGGSLVGTYTGITFASGTSVGAGQVLEFYVNLGMTGVLIGFFGLGFLLMRLDHGVMRALADGDVRGLLLRAMPGLTLLQPGGNLLEIIVAFVGAIAGAQALLYLGVFGNRLSTQSAAPIGAR